MIFLIVLTAVNPKVWWHRPSRNSQRVKSSVWVGVSPVMTWWICISGYGKLETHRLDEKKKVDNGIHYQLMQDFLTNQQSMRNEVWLKVSKGFLLKLKYSGIFWMPNLILFNISDRTSMFRTRWQIPNSILSIAIWDFNLYFLLQDPQVLSNGLGWLHIKDFIEKRQIQISGPKRKKQKRLSISAHNIHSKKTFKLKFWHFPTKYVIQKKFERYALIP